MKLPDIPTPSPLSSITPSFYNAILRCKAQAAWRRYGAYNAFPSSSLALLGTAFHTVAEAASRGNLPVELNARREVAYGLFEREAERLLHLSHPFMRQKFRSIQELPHFHQLQAQAAEASIRIENGKFNSSWQMESSTDTTPKRFAERKFASRDGMINGRIDLVDGAGGVIYDYKSGADPEQITESETRQMRLYAYLCAENEIQVDRAIIVRSSGRQDELLISPADAENEALAAISALNLFNLTAKGNFNEMASPSLTSCKGCPCRAVCEPFWKASTPEWASEVGMCAEGEVQSIRSSGIGKRTLIALQINVSRGTVVKGIDTVSSLPTWASEADGDEPLHSGDIVRIMGARPSLKSIAVPSLSNLPGNVVAEIWRVS